MKQSDKKLKDRFALFGNGALARTQESSQSEYVHMDYFHVFWIFVICSIAGLLVETIVSYPIDGVWKDRAGLVWGPFSPIYGAGGVLMTLALHNLQKSNPFVIFIAAAFVGATFELLAGWFFETAFGIVAWSYADQPFNIGGHTCLGIACVWGAIGLAWTKLIMPPVLHLIDRIPKSWRHPLTVIFTVYMAADIAVTLVSFDCWYERMNGEPIAGAVQQLFATFFSDSFMQERFQTMSVFTDLANR